MNQGIGGCQCDLMRNKVFLLRITMDILILYPVFVKPLRNILNHICPGNNGEHLHAPANRQCWNILFETIGEQNIIRNISFRAVICIFFYSVPFLLIVIETLISTAIVIVVGEFVPKTIFRFNPNGKLNFLAFPVYLIYIILYPISLFTTWLSRMLLRMLGIRIDKENTAKAFSKVDLDYFVQSALSGKEEDSQPDQEVRIFQNVLDFSNVKTRDCMVPRNEICAVEKGVSWNALREMFIETGYSKILVYEEDMDHIIGYIHSSELFRHKDDWRDHIQTVPFVPETLAAQKLMKQLMARKKSLAVVVDEFGGTSGIVSLEDIIEEILGEIEDEHDVQNLIAKKTDEGYLLSGRMEIDRVNSMFGLDIPESDEYMTVGGLILTRTKGFPKVNEKVNVGDYSFRILKRGETKIELVELTLNK
jgi:CBS domain containing-hemolysin-like protein